MTDESRKVPGQPPIGASAATRGTGGAGLQSLGHLRGIVLTNPRLAQRVLTEQRVADHVVRETLRAETLIRLGNPRAAATAATGAVEAAAAEDPVAPARLLPAAVVLADCAILSGAPDAASGCIDLKHLAREYADLPRMVVAVALRGVAIYHQRSCRHARRLFSGLHVARARMAGVDAIAVALAEARDTIDACCAARQLGHKPPVQPPAFTVGGLVQSELTPSALADRILRLPGCHDCAAA
jgi:hypothetical protein